jgi:hypothetical protein
VVTIPAGSDACQELGPLNHSNPSPLGLTNDGPLVAFSTQDGNNDWSIWLGDLRNGSIKAVYAPPEKPGYWTEVGAPKLANGRLVWIDSVYEVQDRGLGMVASPEEWSVQEMDLASGSVSVMAHYRVTGSGDGTSVSWLGIDGERLGLAEELADGHWQIQLRDLGGNVDATIPVDRVLVDFVLVSDGVLYVTAAEAASGAEDPVGPLRLFRWTETGGSKQIATDSSGVYVYGQGDIAAWVVGGRLYAATAPFESPRAISRVRDPMDEGVTYVACGSGMVAWEEGQASTLALWQPGWASPVQVPTEAQPSTLSVGGGWLVWHEWGEGMSGDGGMARIRGVPISVLAAGR